MENNNDISLDISRFLNSEINIKINNQEEYERFIEELQKCGISMRKDEKHIYNEECPVYFMIPGENYIVKFPIGVAKSYKDFADLDFVKEKEENITLA